MKRTLSYLVLLSIIVSIACQKEVNEDLTIPFLKTDSTTLSFSDSAGKKDSFTVQSNITWHIAISPASADWLQLSIDSGNGNLKIYVTTLAYNLTDSIKKASLVISPVNNMNVQPVTVQVAQNKPVKRGNLYGGSEHDHLFHAVVTPDGGLIAVGTTASNNGDISGLHGTLEDVWIIKVDTNGNKVWQKVLGGLGRDFGGLISKTADGNYIISASTDNADNDRPYRPRGGTWIIKINDNGDLIWQKILAGVSARIYAIKPANNGGYILVGSEGPLWSGDLWSAKMDENANLIWQRSLGGSLNDEALSVEPVPGGGYLVTGTTESSDGDIVGNHQPEGRYDLVVYKIDENGNKVWLKCFGGSWIERGASIIKANDGNFIIAGYANSNNGDVRGNHGSADMWILKINGNGNLLWLRSFGGSSADIAEWITSASDGGYIIGGTTWSDDGDVVGHKDDLDGWIVKIDENGNKQWQQTLGGRRYDHVWCVVERSAGNYTAIGSTGSFDNDGDVAGHKGGTDGWIIKFKK